MKWPAAKTWNLALLCSHPFYPRSDPGPPSGRPPHGLAQAQAHCSIQRAAARGEGKEGTHRRTGARSWFIALLRCCALAIRSPCLLRAFTSMKRRRPRAGAHHRFEQRAEIGALKSTQALPALQARGASLGPPQAAVAFA